MRKRVIYVLLLFVVTTSLPSCKKESVSGHNNPQKPEPEEIIHYFSVSDNRKVLFSPGNLQYQPSGHIWKFADNQYDIIGSTNSNISSSYSGWIDLFGWGTSGRHVSGDTYNTCYAPTSSKNVYKPENNYNATGYGPSMNMPDINLTGTSAVYDWGVDRTFMHRGTTINSQWRTLSKEEWTYLLDTRSCKTVSGVPNARYANIMVNYVRGLIVFPDNYVHPQGISNINPMDINGDKNEYENTHSTFSIQDWDKMEKQGAIFLPAGGFREGIEVKAVNTHEFYWTTTRINKGYSECVRFQSAVNRFSRIGCNYDGLSVRLVKDYCSN